MNYCARNVLVCVRVCDTATTTMKTIAIQEYKNRTCGHEKKGQQLYVNVKMYALSLLFTLYFLYFVFHWTCTNNQRWVRRLLYVRLFFNSLLLLLLLLFASGFAAIPLFFNQLRSVFFLIFQRTLVFFWRCSFFFCSFIKISKYFKSDLIFQFFLARVLSFFRSSFQKQSTYTSFAIVKLPCYLLMPIFFSPILFQQYSFTVCIAQHRRLIQFELIFFQWQFSFIIILFVSEIIIIFFIFRKNKSRQSAVEPLKREREKEKTTTVLLELFSFFVWS